MKGSIIRFLTSRRGEGRDVEWIPFIFWTLSTVICWGCFGPSIKAATMLHEGAYHLSVRCIAYVYLVLGVGFCSLKIFWLKSESGSFSKRGAHFGALAGICAGLALPVLSSALLHGPSTAQIMAVVFVSAPLGTIGAGVLWKRPICPLMECPTSRSLSGRLNG